MHSTLQGFFSNSHHKIPCCEDAKTSCPTLIMFEPSIICHMHMTSGILQCKWSGTLTFGPCASQAEISNPFNERQHARPKLRSDMTELLHHSTYSSVSCIAEVTKLEP